MPEACDTGGPDWGSDWGHPRTRAARPWAILDVVNHDKRSGTMTEINVIVTGPEEAYDNEAEFWCGREQMGVTVLHEGRLHLRIDPRPDGSPWLAY
jgi:hypothetical protein